MLHVLKQSCLIVYFSNLNISLQGIDKKIITQIMLIFQTYLNS